MRLLIDYIIATTYLYGIVNKETVFKIYNAQNDNHVSIEDIQEIIINPPGALETSYVYIENDHFVHETICVFDEFDFYIKEKSDKPYYMPEKRELLKYVDDNYFEKNEAYYNFKNYLIKNFFRDDKERAIDLCDEIHIGFSLDYSIKDALDSLSYYGVESNSIENQNKLINLLQDLSNNTRRWINNGYTPLELFEIYSKENLNTIDKMTLTRPLKNPHLKKQKVGRNDPCPCGSGKKYKKCCLNK